MNILKAIGALFTKLWRWIKETAWVQPLLIVGTIFAVIFSIPKMTNWVQALGVSTSDSFYMERRLSLNTETDNPTELTSQADELTSFITDWSYFPDQEGYYSDDPATNDYDHYRAALNADQDAKAAIDKYGEKFFLAYVSKGCSNCEKVQGGFEMLANSDYWGKSYIPEDGRDFKLHTIYADQDSDNDDNYDGEYKKAFVRYLDKFDDIGFWPDAGERLENAPYATNDGVNSSGNYQSFAEANHNDFQIPTVLLIDFSREAFELNKNRVGVSEVLFGISGDTDFDKAELLMQMWNHTTKTDLSNKFSDVYVKA